MLSAGALKHSLSEYQERVSREIVTIRQMGFPSYFLIVADFIKFARDRGIPVGPGRGSAAGSLGGYALGIPEIYALKYHLQYERFWNPERKWMPDIDTDFCIERRDEMIKYTTEKYGADRVSQINTINRM